MLRLLWAILQTDCPAFGGILSQSGAGIITMVTTEGDGVTTDGEVMAITEVDGVIMEVMAIMEVDGVITEGAATMEGVAMAEAITEDFVELRPLTVQVTSQRMRQAQTIS
jgi:hypothetical protein